MVLSVNGQTGDVVLDASDVGAASTAEFTAHEAATLEDGVHGGPTDRELAYTAIGGGDTDIAIPDFLTIQPVGGMTVTVPDVPSAVYVHARSVISSPDTADWYAGVAIAPTGTSGANDADDIAAAYILDTAGTTIAYSHAVHRVPPNTPGTYQMFVWGGAVGTLRLRSDFGTPRIWLELL